VGNGFPTKKILFSPDFPTATANKALNFRMEVGKTKLIFTVEIQPRTHPMFIFNIFFFFSLKTLGASLGVLGVAGILDNFWQI
jgi:hypothetical protein